MDDKLNIGIIGCGWAGERHARVYYSLMDVKIVNVADVDGGKAKELARWGVEASHRGYRRVLGDTRQMSSIDVSSLL